MVACPNSAIRKEGEEYVTSRGACLACGDCVDVCCAEGREIVGTEMTTAQVMQEIEKDRVFFDQSGGGVTFSGGEPLLQHEFLLSLLKSCRQRSVHTTVDTSGYAPQPVLDRLRTYIDLFLFDLKILDDGKHREFTGVSNRLIIENLRHLAQSHAHVIVRIPIIPGFNDELSEIRKTASFVASIGTVSEIHVLPYHTSGTVKYDGLGVDYRMRATRSPSTEFLGRVVDELKGHHLAVSIGG